MELWVYSRRAIEAVQPHEVPHVIISITSGPDDVARLRLTDMCRAVLRLVFVDAEEPSPQHAEPHLFSREQALQIWRFVHEHRAHAHRLVIHCDAGVSRSPAVAAAVAWATNGDRDHFMSGRYRPNMRVYRTLLDTHAELNS